MSLMWASTARYKDGFTSVRCPVSFDGLIPAQEALVTVYKGPTDVASYG
jgi:hypothetical protein